MDVVTFGEVLLRLSPPGSLRIKQARSLDTGIVGSEMNVAASLAAYGLDAALISALPNNPLGELATNHLRLYGINTSFLQYTSHRLGTYYLETGESIRGSKVVYDRENSATAMIQPGMIDWEQVFSKAKLFHWSGITPALSSSAAEVLEEALIAAKDKGITVSVDLNHRTTLWKYGKKPHEVMQRLLPYCQLLLGDLKTANMMLDLAEIDPDYRDHKALIPAYKRLNDALPELKLMSTTLRWRESASHHRISGVLYENENLYTAETYHITPIVDRVGSGDAYMGGLLYGYLSFQEDYQKMVEFATAACALKHTIVGDVNVVDKEEIYNVMNGSISGNISR